jgi:hypothetical protein
MRRCGRCAHVPIARVIRYSRIAVRESVHTRDHEIRFGFIKSVARNLKSPYV